MKDSFLLSLKKNRILPVITGPTASGKTALAVDLADLIEGEIISADSRQVYRRMDLGTGKDLFEYQRGDKKIPYHCIDIAEPQSIFTLQDYQLACYQAIRSIQKKITLPILCGGTGLYLEAVLKHYQIPAVKENPLLRTTLESDSRESLEKKLQELSPSLHRTTDLSSKKRIIRAIEIASTSPLALPERKKIPQFTPCIILITFPKEVLIKRIDWRLEERLKAGMIEEVKQLIDTGVSLERLKLFGMEYRFIGSYLFNEISYDEMKKELTTAIHRLAKRQRTWFNGMSRRGLTVHPIEEAKIEQVLPILQKFLQDSMKLT